MRKALGSIPSVSISARQVSRDNPAAFGEPTCGGNCVAHLQFPDWTVALATARLAQPAERKALNLVVVGSRPTVGDMTDMQSVKLAVRFSTNVKV